MFKPRLAALVGAIAALAPVLVLPSLAQTVPQTRAKALDGTIITFPRPTGQKPMILVLGFSHKSSDACEAWNKRLDPLYLSNPHVEDYTLIDLQGLPSFIIAMIEHGIRRELPPGEHAHFAPFLSNEKEWKQIAAYSAPNDAYLLVVDPAGHPVWQWHGTFDEGKLNELNAAVSHMTTEK
jgi:hypothetical protein